MCWSATFSRSWKSHSPLVEGLEDVDEPRLAEAVELSDDGVQIVDHVPILARPQRRYLGR